MTELQILFDKDIISRTDIDEMETSIRHVRTSTSSSMHSNNNRCNILETSAYMEMRMTLLRWLQDNGKKEELPGVVKYHIGGGIAVSGMYNGTSPPRVIISWRQTENLPVMDDKKKKIDEDYADDEEDGLPTYHRKKRTN